MVIAFVDVVGSTEHSERYGAAGVGAIVETLEKFETALRGNGHVRTVDDRVSVVEPAMRLGPPQGDGFLLVGDDADAANMLTRAIDAQQDIATVLPVRITLGIGEPVWVGPPRTATSTVVGRTVNIVARLQAACPPRGIALEEGMHAKLSDFPALRQRAIRHEVTLKGIAAPVTYWTIERFGEVTAPRADAVPGCAKPPHAEPVTAAANGNELSFRLWGFAAKLRGQQTIMVSLLLATLVGLGWVTVAPMVRAAAEVKAELLRTATEVKLSVDKKTDADHQEHQTIIDAIDTTNYILAECLRARGGDCPRLPRPKRLESLIGPRGGP